MKQVKQFGVVITILAASGLAAGAASAQCGAASWYHEGARTATGERYNPDGVTAAHRTLPFGARVVVRHQRTGRAVTVRINDRGPFIRGRIIDLSRGAKRALGMDGLAPVCIEVVGRGGQEVASLSKPRRHYASRRSSVKLAAHRSGGTRLAARLRKGVRYASLKSSRPKQIRLAKRSNRTAAVTSSRRKPQSKG